MRRTKAAVCVLLLVCVVGTTGCGTNPLFDLLNAGLKIANGQISDISAVELKTLNEVAVGIISEVTGTAVDPLTTAQAEAVVAFLDANDIDTADDIEALVDQATNDPSSIQGLDDLAAAFSGSDIDIDPNNVDPEELEELFEAIFTGSAGAPSFD